MYEIYYEWSYAIGRTIMGARNGEDLLRKLIFNIRAEETPGRFLDRLAQTLGEYKTNRNIGLDITIHKDIYKCEWFADSFYYLKSAILTGLLNALKTGGS
ncbi:MAG: hypothetical protein RMJ59_04700 [Candidatus Nitrosocaldus sp.]|nr:hypothetical protein [Candidatus Nitrosocaldus sp.]MDW8275664.1 hypothetical protein [Candidatus Nitrosocaldus sp.]